MADPTTMQRCVPVGYRFCPTEEELVAYYLRRKLMAHDPSIYNNIPEIDVCKYEPWELQALAASAFPETEQDDSECYFFTRCDYKYSNSSRLNRTTPLGYWKVTGKDRQIKDYDTNKVIGIKKNLVYYEGRVPHGILGNWSIHEYHMFPLQQRTYVVCKLMKKYEKKTKQKTNDFEHDSIGPEMESNNHTDFKYENPANFSILSKEHYLSNMNSTVQTFLHHEVRDSAIHASFQHNEAINSKTQTSFQPNEEYQSNEDIDSMIQAFYPANEVLPPELNSIMDPPLDFDYEDFTTANYSCSWLQP